MSLERKCLFIFLSSTDCEYGDVKLENEIPFIFAGGAFHPICGHYFWALHDQGVNLFCKTLGFSSGALTSKQIPLTQDAMRVGGCVETDTNLTKCSGGCNDMEVGGACPGIGTSKCMAGKNAGLTVKCDGMISTFKLCGRGLYDKLL